MDKKGPQESCALLSSLANSVKVSQLNCVLLPHGWKLTLSICYYKWQRLVHYTCSQWMMDQGGE